MPRHFHTTAEAIILTALGTAVAFHAFRFLGAKLSKSDNGKVAKTGRAIAGVFTFGTSATGGTS